MSDAEEDALYDSIRFLQQEGGSSPELDEWAQRYEHRQQASATQALREADGEFVILLANSKVGRVVRAIGPVTGRISAEGLASRLIAMYDDEWEGYTVKWTASVVPLDTNVAEREQEIEWVASGRPDDEADADEDDEPESPDGTH